ncbi:hypothetical protein IW146_001592 [Coemansia sp. RSA 922]|nr:hypothetical protein GGI14_001435 [Coemansia sp. S680]KAJ2034069.1 hypothetical protein H4S03_005231 [Coemansia sp. S3946]KAJ2069573.1 hypothetical protein GGH13_004472 [Coemansia sp. S155-1]KAJ2116353.1 hypothetical protein IW146_001592 [Coemansia sp. RSA 922]
MFTAAISRQCRAAALARSVNLRCHYSHTYSHTHPRPLAAGAAAAAERSSTNNNSLDELKPSPNSHSGPAFKYFSKRDAKFVLSATKPEHYKRIPPNPEVTFAGRSNVGKSSLLSAVLRSQGLVKTSKKPGHTSALNFFSLTSGSCPGAISLVDMPGYGYRSRDEWGGFIMKYLSTRKELRRVFLLIEAKVGELKATDLSFLELAEQYKTPVQIVLTKTDKMKRADLDSICKSIIQSATDIAPSVVQPTAICCSSRTKIGIDDLQLELLRVCDLVPSGEPAKQ